MIEAHPPGVQLPEELARLHELALNLRWAWDRGARALFRQIYPELWDQIVDNPWLVLRAASALHPDAHQPLDVPLVLWER
jgi:hypothetical protein